MFVYKKLKVSDVSITPFEAHKQYNYVSSSAGDNGITFGTTSWSLNNKSLFTSGNIKYFQLDKMLYRNYITDNANLIPDVNYLKQERRLYDKFNYVSIPQNLFGNRIQPTTINITGSFDGNQINVIDDGQGNIYPITYTLGEENWPKEERRLVYIGPVDGYRNTDLSININTGQPLVNHPTSFTRENVYDDSYYLNQVDYNKVIFSNGLGTPLTLINTSGSGGNGYLRLDHSEAYNFGFNEDFNISFYFYTSGENNENQVSGSATGNNYYFIAKSDIKTIIPSINETQNTFVTGNLQPLDVPAENKYPFKVYYTHNLENTGSVVFERSNGSLTSKVITPLLYSGSVTELMHLSFQKTGDLLEIYKNGTKIASGSDIDPVVCKDQPPKNQANLYIGTRGNIDSYLNSNLSQIMIFNQALSETQIQNVSQSITGTPYIGNAFYDEGFITITHPSYIDYLFNESVVNDFNIVFKNTHLIFEHEYQCSIDEDEYNYTQNVSVRKGKSNTSDELADCLTGSLDNSQITLFKPYVTTIGLYDDNYNLLAVGKMAQPVKISEETDMTLVIRWDS